MRCLGLWILAVLFLCPALGVAQSPSSTDFLSQAGTLQSKLREWQRSLSELDANSVRVNDGVRRLISQDRSAGLAALKRLDDEISGLEAKPTLEAQAQVVFDLDGLKGVLANVSDDLGMEVVDWRNLSLTTPPAQSPLKGNAITSQLWDSTERLKRQLAEEVNAAMLAGSGETPSAPRTGQISGHIDAADTGKPLAGATVELKILMGPDPLLPPSPARLLTHSAADGSYGFSSLAAGTYQVSAYHAGFAGGDFGSENSPGEWTPLTVPSEGRQNGVFHGPGGVKPLLAVAGKLDGIDLSLHPVPGVSEMNAEALGADQPEDRVQAAFRYGRFSPDGKLFAVTIGDPEPQAVWLYDLASRRLTEAVPQSSQPLTVDSMGWIGDTLYAHKGLNNRGNPSYYVATVEGTKEVAELPPAAEKALDKPLGSNAEGLGNSRFKVKLQGALHGSFSLDAQTADGRETIPITGGSWELQSFIFLPDRSLVFYPAPSYPAIGVFDLNSRKVQEIYLPAMTLNLLDVKHVSGCLLIGYTTSGPCDPGLPSGGVEVRPRYRPMNVCFTKIPWVEKK